MTNGSFVYEQLFSPEAGTNGRRDSVTDELVKLEWQEEHKALLAIFKPSIFGIPLNLHISVITQVDII